MGDSEWNTRSQRNSDVARGRIPVWFRGGPAWDPTLCSSRFWVCSCKVFLLLFCCQCNEILAFRFLIFFSGKYRSLIKFCYKTWTFGDPFTASYLVSQRRFPQNKRLSMLFLGRFYEMLTTSSTRKALLVGCMLVSMQDLSGINLIL